MRYETPDMRLLMLEAEDIITLSNAGTNTEDGDQNMDADLGGGW